MKSIKRKCKKINLGYKKKGEIKNYIKFEKKTLNYKIMKNIFFTITLIGMLLSCKKEDSSQTNNNQSETTKNTSDLGLVNSIDCSSLILIGKLKKG